MMSKMDEEEKITDFKDLQNIQKDLQQKKTVLVGGCFDVFHFGHLMFLKQAKKAGEKLVVALESDETVEKLKKRKPIHTQEKRARILASLIFVDLVILLPPFESNQEYEKLVKAVKPYIIAITQGDERRDIKEKQVKLVGGRVKIVCPLIKDFSSTKIIRHAHFSSN